MILLLIPVLFIGQLLGISGQTLDVVLADGALPIPLFHATTVYDGKDSVYILGGISDGINSGDLLKYSISADQVEIIGSGVRSQTASGVWTKDEKLFQFGGKNQSNWAEDKIWSASTNDPSNWSHVATFPFTLGFTASIWDGNESSYIIGGDRGGIVVNDAIFKYSHTNHGISIVGRVPSGRFWPSAVWDENGKQAYIFNGWSGVTPGDIVKFDPATGTVSKLDDHNAFAFMSCAVWTGTEAYIIGGFSTTFTIYRFNPSTNSLISIPVNNGPTEGLFALGCAYVKELNRIYLFGGAMFGDYGTTRDIRYVELTI